MQRLTFSLAIILFCSLTQSGLSAEPVDYAEDVKPILAKHCLDCHGPEKQESGLRLDAGRLILRGGDRGKAVVPGKSGQSRLYRVITGKGEIPQMPLEGPKLSQQEVAVIKRWIDQGAAFPEDEQVAGAGRQSDHWSFQPVRRPDVPEVENEQWVRNPIDNFILSRLQKENLKPSAEADRVTLIRRLSLDLRGLPPSPKEVDRFLADEKPGAYQRLVDRFLASPHFGERWAQHWLDVARYADSNGYTIDSSREIWKYRDWVIDAFNRDMPFDQFTIEQLAGDMLPAPSRQQLIATGFHRNTLINEEGGTDDEQFRVEAVVDRVETTGAAFLGLTIGCARCHEHKFDPITQREFYQMFAIFNNCREPKLRLATEEQEQRLQLLDDRLAAARKALKQFKAKQKAEAEKQKQKGEQQPDKKKTEDKNRKRLEQNVKELQQQKKKLQAAIPTTMILRERNNPRKTHIHIRGNFLDKGARVEPGTPAVLHSFPEKVKQPDRLDFARWLFDRDNPLTARVTVNRFWQRLFGLGLVETENDFGTQGTPPSHPKLLDWLADEFRRQEWGVKAMLRTIVTSATYRQSSQMRPELLQRDPRNRLLARQSRFRVEAEIVRDVALAASGLLTRELGGPSVYPPQPKGIYALTQKKKKWPTDTGPDRYRRGMYIFLWRSSPYPFLPTFDMPDRTSTCTRRSRSNTPLQALTLANNRVFVELAKGLARRILTEGPSADQQRLQFAFRLCLSRQPTDKELTRMYSFLNEQRRRFAEQPKKAKVVAPGDLPKGVSAETAAAWTATARVLMNLDEFLTRE